jgi:hypothetical protein
MGTKGAIDIVVNVRTPQEMAGKQIDSEHKKMTDAVPRGAREKRGGGEQKRHHTSRNLVCAEQRRAVRTCQNPNPKPKP